MEPAEYSVGADGANHAALRYLLRTGGLSPFPHDFPSTVARAEGRRSVRVAGIGRPDKDDAVSTGGSQGLMVGLATYSIPFGLHVSGGSRGLDFTMSVWSKSDSTSSETLERRRDVLETMVRGMAPVVELTEVDLRERVPLPLGGIAVGVPGGMLSSPMPADPEPRAGPATPSTTRRRGGPAAPTESSWNRLARMMAGTTWSASILAQPVDEATLDLTRTSLLNEIRDVKDTMVAAGGSDPLAEQYLTVLTEELQSLTEAGALGGWRTAVYLQGDATSYPLLSAAWRNVFVHPTHPGTVKTYDLPEAVSLAADWVMPDVPGAAGPRSYRRPWEYQTLLTSAQMASYVDLPDSELPGFRIQEVARFDRIPRGGSPGDALLGRVAEHNLAGAGDHDGTGEPYGLDPDGLTSHALVAGITGSGKTNTTMQLVSAVADRGCPFLIIEPTKAEYRSLRTRFGDDLTVFTLGNEVVSPLRLNPFEPSKGTPVSLHLDLLKAAFGAAFGMWTPLPQVLEQCLYEIYLDSGWNLRDGTNRRQRQGDTAGLYPTMADLVRKVPEVTRKQGYDEKIESDLRAALLTRLSTLQLGAKGAMLDVEASIPDELLFDRPVVIELEALGSDDDKALVMGLLFLRLFEYRRVQGASSGLRHLLVIEEAHRLLSRGASKSSEDADPRGQAVETFVNILAEIRAYGQGVVVADQVPVRLAPEVVKNTNLKLIHRIVSLEDRDVLAGATAMTAAQARSLPTLGKGMVAAFQGGDDRPVLVQVSAVKDDMTATRPSDAELAAAASRWRAASGLEPLFTARSYCARTCATSDICDAARSLAADPKLQKSIWWFYTSLGQDPAAVQRLWPILHAQLRARQPAWVPNGELEISFVAHATDAYVRERGASAGWSRATVDDLQTVLVRAVTDHLAGSDGGAVADAASDALVRLATRTDDPMPLCGEVCGAAPGPCQFRDPVRKLVASRRFERSWGEVADATPGAQELDPRWSLCQSAAEEIVEFPSDALTDAEGLRVVHGARRASLCLAQHFADADSVSPVVRRKTVEAVFNAAIPGRG